MVKKVKRTSAKSKKLNVVEIYTTNSIMILNMNSPSKRQRLSDSIKKKVYVLYRKLILNI